MLVEFGPYSNTLGRGFGRTGDSFAGLPVMSPYLPASNEVSKAGEK